MKSPPNNNPPFWSIVAMLAVVIIGLVVQGLTMFQTLGSLGFAVCIFLLVLLWQQTVQDIENPPPQPRREWIWLVIIFLGVLVMIAALVWWYGAARVGGQRQRGLQQQVREEG